MSEFKSHIPKDLLNRWLDKAENLGSTYILVFFNQFDKVYFPVYIREDQDVDEIRNETETASDMFVHEIDISQDKTTIMNGIYLKF